MYVDVLHFLPLVSRQRAGAVQSFIGVQMTVFKRPARLIRRLPQEFPSQPKLTHVGWRVCAGGIKAFQPSIEKKVVVNILKAHLPVF